MMVFGLPAATWPGKIVRRGEMEIYYGEYCTKNVTIFLPLNPSTFLRKKVCRILENHAIPNPRYRIHNTAFTIPHP